MATNDEQSIKKYIVRDPHGKTKKAGALSVVGDVHVSVDGDVGTPTADSTYENGELNITFHDIKGERGNGIESIETTESQEEGEDNTVVIKTTDYPTVPATTLHVKNGSKGNGIASSTEQMSQLDGGVNTFIFVDDKGYPHEFHTRNGRTGKQGALAVYDSSQEYPPFEFDTKPGQSQEMGMTQKAITDAMLLEFDGLELGEYYGGYIQFSTGKKKSSSNNFTARVIPNDRYSTVKANVQMGNSDSDIAVIAFYNSAVINDSSYISSASVVGDAGTSKEYSAPVPDGCKYIVVSSRTEYEDYSCLLSRGDDISFLDNDLQTEKAKIATLQETSLQMESDVEGLMSDVKTGVLIATKETSKAQLPVRGTGSVKLRFKPDMSKLSSVGDTNLFRINSNFFLTFHNYDNKHQIYSKVVNVYLQPKVGVTEDKEYDVELVWGNGTASLTVNGVTAESEVDTSGYDEEGVDARGTMGDCGSISGTPYRFLNCELYEAKFGGEDVELSNTTPLSLKDKVDNVVSLCDEIKEQIDNIEQGSSIPTSPFRHHYCHFGLRTREHGNIFDGSDLAVMGSESLENIAFAARLGFRWIEANVKKTLDNKYICIHGSSGTFGAQVKSPYNDYNINETSLDTIKESVRYNIVGKNADSTIPTLEEFCKACKSYGMGVFLGQADLTAAQWAVEFMGEENVILYAAPSAARNFFGGWVFAWDNSSSSTKESILEVADAATPPFMIGLGPSTISNLGDDLDDTIAELHNRKVLVGFAGVYQTDADARELWRHGFDFNGSGGEVDEFEPNHESYDMDLGIEGVELESDGSISLADGDTITLGSETPIIGKGMLVVRCVGTLEIVFGSAKYTAYSGQPTGYRLLESDGTLDEVMSDYFYKRGTTCTLTAQGNVTITTLTYKTSKV